MYCTLCGRPLPASGICPKCAKLPPQGAAHPLGKTVYDFCDSPALLVLALIWTLATLWAAFFVLWASLLVAPLFLPNALFCLGLWITYSGWRSRHKRAGLSLASGSLLVILTLLTVILTMLCLISFYGIFLCASDRDSYYLVPSLLKLVLAFFLLMPISILFLNKLRKVIRTACGALRGNRGMAVCPIPAIVFCGVFSIGGVLPALFSTRLDSSFQLIDHAISRLPFGLSTLAPRLMDLTWQGLIPVHLGFSVALLVTAVVLILYRNKLRSAMRNIVRSEGTQAPGKREKTGDPVQI